MWSMRSSSRFDLVLFGATGFTGGLVADYLAGSGPAGLRWAIAGRDRNKLEAVARRAGDRAQPEVIVVDASDETGLADMAARTNAVISTVGPYAKYGSPLVAACVGAGIAYCDLTGELQWIRRMIDQHHHAAQNTGARIVHSCGFDSIPSDLGVLVLQDAAIRAHGQPAQSIVNLVGPLRGGASGGTVASMFNIADEMKRDPLTRRVLSDPYSLCDAPWPTGPDGRDSMGVGYDRTHRVFTAPFIMAGGNARIVRRSHQLLGTTWGTDFSYREMLAFPTTGKGAGRAVAMAAGTTGLLVGMAIAPVRRVLEDKLPKPGQGPSEAQRVRGSYTMNLWGHRAGWPSPLRVTVGDNLDPGYGSTSRMLAEAGLALAFDPAISGGGVLTPASALGLPLVRRLRGIGMRFDVGT